jgi:hypothetical protein
MVLIPFTSDKTQFVCQLGNYIFRFATLFNDFTAVWYFDLIDAQTDEVICYQIPILLGEDMLYPLNLGIGAMFAADMSATGIDATADDLGDRIIVAYYTEDEKVAYASANGLTT